jgi:methionine-rich copper-binding protein CopC
MKPTPRLAVIALLLAATNAWASAFLDHAEPAVGGTVETPPTEIKIWFTESLEPPFCQIQLIDRHGRPVTQSRATVDSSDPSLLTLSVPALTPGRYKVNWRAVSVDAHMTVGTFSFTFRKARRQAQPQIK